MTDCVTATLPLVRWQGDRGTYHLVEINGEQAEQITMHARLHRLEFGRQRGFGSVKVIARIGETSWKSSVFPQKAATENRQEEPRKNWMLLVSKKVCKAEDLSVGVPVQLTLEMI